LALALLAFLGAGALFGGWALATAAPGEDPIGMPLAWLAGTPFSSYLIPGILLFSVFGVGSCVAIVAGLLRHWTAPYLAFLVGVGQMIWIVVEAAIMWHVGMHPFQPTMFACGAVIAAAAFAWGRAVSRQTLA
jgi:hypothetical protein